MTFNGWLQIALYAVLVVLLTKPMGGYMTRVFAGERTLLRPVLRPIELGIYKMCGVEEDEEQHWVGYAIAMLAFSFAGFVIMYGIQRLQNVLPLNPQGQDAVSPDLAFNTSVSFMTNTNWQSYVPETTMRSHADDCVDGAQLRLGGHRYFAGNRVDPWLCTALRTNDRQFLGRSDPLRAVHPAPDLRRGRSGADLARHAG